MKTINFYNDNIRNTVSDDIVTNTGLLQRILSYFQKTILIFEISKTFKDIVPQYKLGFMALSGSKTIIERFLMASVKKI